jgi:hypothetical protein
MGFEIASFFDSLMSAIGLGELYSDMSFVLKIFAFLMIVNFTRARLGFGILSSFVTMFISYYIIFENWSLFGPLTIFYVFLMFGILRVIQDFYFVAQGTGVEVERLKPGYAGREAQMQKQAAFPRPPGGGGMA